MNIQRFQGKNLLRKSVKIRPQSLVPLIAAILFVSLPSQTARGASLPPAVFDFAVYATGMGCGALTIAGNASVDSFNSSQGSYSHTKQLSQGIVGVSGN